MRVGMYKALLKVKSGHLRDPLNHLWSPVFFTAVHLEVLIFSNHVTVPTHSQFTLLCALLANRGLIIAWSYLAKQKLFWCHPLAVTSCWSTSAFGGTKRLGMPPLLERAPRLIDHLYYRFSPLPDWVPSLQFLSRLAIKRQLPSLLPIYLSRLDLPSILCDYLTFKF